MSRNHKIRCREIAAYALKVGRIKKPAKCAWCPNRGPLVKHHDRYDEPLMVTWLCTKCHALLEGAKRRRVPT